ncbi:MAG: Asp-tRNA(Asn)/Glu-tRNA(Gln) amidotransferase subunit GatB [bacterium]
MASDKYDIIIGLEIHTELKTKSKMFCSCNNDARQVPANTYVCPICLGHPGTLPVVNQQALDWALLLALSLHCEINQTTKFDRKNYFYPDLPKGYQISQYDLPLAHHGWLEVIGHKIDITRIHLEEDTGKLTHPRNQEFSLADYNRAGTPLIEMVTEPVIKDAHQAKKFCQKFQQILRYLNISNADMEKGEMRCEANVSLQTKDKWQYIDGQIKALNNYRLNPKVEVKNINSFYALEKAIEFEIKRQATILDKGETIIAETRGWDDKQKATVSQRLKETAADYRYFPEPDIPPLVITSAYLKKIKAQIKELPDAKRLRFIEQYGFSEQEANFLVSDRDLAAFAENTISELQAWLEANNLDWASQQSQLIKLTVNWLSNELLKHLKINNHKIKDIKITPENLAELICLIHQNKINFQAGQMVFNQMYQVGGDPSDIVQKMNLEQMDNDEELIALVKKIIADHPQQAQDYQNGKTALSKFFVGQTMTASQGKANPQKITDLVKQLLT